MVGILAVGLLAHSKRYTIIIWHLQKKFTAWVGRICDDQNPSRRAAYLAQQINKNYIPFSTCYN